jgi:hypothetical protein
MIYTALCVRFLMWADRLHGEVVLNSTRLSARAISQGAHKTRDFQRQPPTTSQRNLSAHIKTLRKGPYKS